MRKLIIMLFKGFLYNLLSSDFNYGCSYKVVERTYYLGSPSITQDIMSVAT